MRTMSHIVLIVVLDNTVSATNTRVMSTAPSAPPAPHRITDVEGLEAIVGRASLVVTMKQLDALDDGCRRLLAASPIAGFGFHDRAGRPHTTLVGGVAGFVHVDSARRISFGLPDGPVPADRGGVSFLFLQPGVGETLRLNGSAVARSGSRLTVTVEEVYVHCARCVLRSGLWGEPRPGPPARPVGGDGPLADPEIAGFLASAPFLVLSSRDAQHAADTSPRGDHPGFARILDGRTVAVPDRRGNRRTDTFHNLLSDPRISAGVLVPGRTDVLHLSGTGSVTDDPALLAGMALGGRVPQAALLVDVEHADLRPNEALHTSRLWDRSAQVERATAPDMTALAGQHLAANRSGGARARVLRLAMTLWNAFPAIARRLMDLGYRRQLRDEGYTATSAGRRQE